MKVLVTGGCGFIGSNFIKHLLENKLVSRVVNVDCQTYAGRGRNLEHMGLDRNPGYSLYVQDISEQGGIEEIFQREKPQMVFNFAAESHVDRSIVN